MEFDEVRDIDTEYGGYTDDDYSGFDTGKSYEDESKVDDYLDEMNLTDDERSRAKSLKNRIRYLRRVAGKQYDEEDFEGEVKKFDPYLVKLTVEIPEDLTGLTETDRASLRDSLREVNKNSLETRLSNLRDESKSLDERIEGLGEDEGEREEALRSAKVLVEEEITNTEIKLQQLKDIEGLTGFKKWLSKDGAMSFLRGIAELSIAAVLLFRRIGAAAVRLVNNLAKGALELAKKAAPLVGGMLKALGSGLLSGAKFIGWLASNLWVFLLLPVLYFAKR